MVGEDVANGNLEGEESLSPKAQIIDMGNTGGVLARESSPLEAKDVTEEIARLRETTCFGRGIRT